ncbi:MAG TPA: hypothetical protein DCG72_04425 [Gammaproteobacteria bacterium]|nr:hypothetical protein [Gammaproteobacteria bacterium]
MGFLSPKVPDAPPPPPIPAVPPDPPIKPKDTKESERVETRAARKKGTQASILTGGQGLLTEAPTAKKTLLGQ